MVGGVHGVLVLDHASPLVLRLVDSQLLQTLALERRRKRSAVRNQFQRPFKYVGL